MVHQQFNLLYQIWIHTEAVRTIGPLEHVLNTPQHHRVHHGSNRYCLDKNYGGVLIIWDRLFGTFEWERSDLETVYGLVYQPDFFHPLKQQLYYYGHVVDKARSMASYRDAISAFVKGPSWVPGTRRLGDTSQVPEKQERPKHDPVVPLWYSIYALFHFSFAFLIILHLDQVHEELRQIHVLFKICFLLWTLTSVGWIFDHCRKAWISETLRCLTCVLLSDFTSSGCFNQELWNTLSVLSLMTSTLCLMSKTMKY